jgi:glycosyltransferase involved in cell wall biosynthesis
VYSHLVIENQGDHAPWEREAIDDRLGTKTLGVGCVVWVYENPDSSTFRYRVWNMVEALRAIQFPATWCRVDEIPVLLRKLSGIGTIVLARVRYDATVAALIVAARSRGIRLLFDCDDLVFDTSFVHLLVDTLDLDTQSVATFDHWFAYVGRLEATARLCDGGIATNRVLATRMASLVGGDVRVVPNFLNRLQQEASEQLFAAKVASRFQSDQPTLIGYFSGTPSHRRDFAVAIPALARLLQQDPKVRLRIVGFLDDLGPLVEFPGQLERQPLLNWVALQKSIAEVDVNIAPLQENAFTNCKSELKYFEAAIVGTWTIASPTVPFAAAMTTAPSGQALGAISGAEEWDSTLEDALRLARSPERYAAAAEAAMDGIRSKYGWNRSTHLIRGAIGDIA